MIHFRVNARHQRILSGNGRGFADFFLRPNELVAPDGMTGRTAAWLKNGLQFHASRGIGDSGQGGNVIYTLSVAFIRTL